MSSSISGVAGVETETEAGRYGGNGGISVMKVPVRLSPFVVRQNLQVLPRLVHFGQHVQEMLVSYQALSVWTLAHPLEDRSVALVSDEEIARGRNVRTVDKDMVLHYGYRLGYDVCTPATILAVRRAYRHQPAGESVFCAMDGIKCPSDGVVRIFKLCRTNGKLAIEAVPGRMRDHFSVAGSRWLFEAGVYR